MQNVLSHFKWIFPVAFLLIACSCNGNDSIPEEQKPRNPNSNPIASFTYLALGDSYTVGENVPYGHSFPLQLSSRILEEKNIELKTTVIAQTGWRTDELLFATQGIEGSEYDLVTLLIGVNNQFQGRSIAQYQNEFENLLERAISVTQGNANKVIVLSIPDYAYTPYGQNSNTAQISAEIDLYNSKAQEITKAKGAVFLSITDITRRGILEPDLVAMDGLHPSGKAYEKFVERLYPLVLSRLKD